MKSHTTSGCRPLLLSAAIVLFSQSLFAIDFKEQLTSGLFLKYSHWNIEKRQLTGYTTIQYGTVETREGRYILETSQNMDADGKSFGKKEVWFASRSGRLTQYREIDFRSKTTVVDRFEGGKIATRISSAGEESKFSVAMDSSLVPFEVIALYLRKMLPEIGERSETHKFTLYLPLIAFELEKSNLPQTFSRIGVEIVREKELELETPLGTGPAIRLLIRPTSFWIRTLLPREKTEFRFTLSQRHPHHLLQFREGDTELTLVEFRQD